MWEMNVKKKIPQFMIIFPKEANVGDTIWMVNIIKKVIYDFVTPRANTRFPAYRFIFRGF